MKISLGWLSDYVDLTGIDPCELVGRLTMGTAEVERVEELSGHLDQVTAAAIVHVAPHPSAERLRLATIDDGAGRRTVVCGAPNCRPGLVVPFAQAGTALPDGQVEQASIRGVPSDGMLCSARELGLSDDHSGLLELPAGTKPGSRMSALCPGRDTVFEIDNKSLTNRPDCWGHIGIAREAAALFARELRLPEREPPPPFDGPDVCTVDVTSPEFCQRYIGLAVNGVAVGPSPDWLQRRLAAVGLRPINNLVDITNYVMLEYGQPMHAFDRSKLAGSAIVVRRALPGERLDALDGRRHELSPDQLVIADRERPVALAGVIGGAGSEIGPETGSIVLESACFDPVSIRRTSTRLGVRTDASLRFEKGQDPENALPALLRAFQLLRHVCPEARPASKVIDVYPGRPQPTVIEFEAGLINRRLGTELADAAIDGILGRLHFRVTRTAGRMRVEVPSFRATGDVSIPADVVEEVGRIHGYDAIPPRPPLCPVEPPAPNRFRRFEWRAREILTGRLGLIEVMGYSFTGPGMLARCRIAEHPDEVRLKNPLSSLEDRIRRTLVPGVLKAAGVNARHTGRFAIFEVGRVCFGERRTGEGLPEEETRVAGCRVDGQAGAEETFRRTKGTVERFLGELLPGIGPVRTPADDSLSVLGGFVQPGAAARVECGGIPVGFICLVHPRVAKEFDLPGRPALFELDLSILSALPLPERQFVRLARYPTSSIDLTVLAGERDPVGRIEAIIRDLPSELLRNVEFVSVFAGGSLPPGRKAVSYRVVFGSDDRTLTREEVAGMQADLIGRLAAGGFPLRTA